MNRKWIIIVWVAFVITTVLIFYVNNYLPKGEMYSTGDIVCQNDDRGPCREEYKEDLTGFSGWVKFFKGSEGMLLWAGLLFAGIVVSSKKEN